MPALVPSRYYAKAHFAQPDVRPPPLKHGHLFFSLPTRFIRASSRHITPSPANTTPSSSRRTSWTSRSNASLVLGQRLARLGALPIPFLDDLHSFSNPVTPKPHQRPGHPSIRPDTHPSRRQPPKQCVFISQTRPARALPRHESPHALRLCRSHRFHSYSPVGSSPRNACRTTPLPP